MKQQVMASKDVLSKFGKSDVINDRPTTNTFSNREQLSCELINHRLARIYGLLVETMNEKNPSKALFLMESALDLTQRTYRDVGHEIQCTGRDVGHGIPPLQLIRTTTESFKAQMDIYKDKGSYDAEDAGEFLTNLGWILEAAISRMASGVTTAIAQVPERALCSHRVRRARPGRSDSSPYGRTLPFPSL
jgi:hypothetical protein